MTPCDGGVESGIGSENPSTRTCDGSIWVWCDVVCERGEVNDLV